MSGTELNELLSVYSADLSRFCYSLCKNSQDADDLFQEVCLKLLKTEFSERSRAETTVYLYRAAVNTFRSTLRSQKRRTESEIAACAAEYIENIPDAESDREKYESLYRAIEKLPFKYRAVVALSYFRGMSESEAAQILSIPPGTVKSRLHKAKQLLKELMNE